MFRHVALFRWSEPLSHEAVTELGDALRACAAAVPSVREYRCGPDVASGPDLPRAEDRYDYGVVADFDDHAGWQAYDLDAEHTRVRAELIRPRLAERIVVQFDC